MVKDNKFIYKKGKIIFLPTEPNAVLSAAAASEMVRNSNMLLWFFCFAQLVVICRRHASSSALCQAECKGSKT